MLKDATPVPTLATADIEKAKDFYDGLGFTHAEGDLPGGIMYTAGTGGFFIYTSAFAGTNKATGMSFDVSDEEFDAIIAELRAKGLAFDTFDVPEAEWTDGVLSGMGMRSVWFRDPDGNILNVSTTH